MTVDAEIIRADITMIDHWLTRARAQLDSPEHDITRVYDWIDRLLDRRLTLMEAR